MQLSDVPGWFTADYEHFYQQFADEKRKQPICVEVGAWMGRSVIDLALKLRGTQATICAVDTWDGRGGSDAMKEVVREAGGYILSRFLENCAAFDICVHAIPLESVLAADLFKNESCDLVFIDASHDYASVKADIKAWRPKVKPCGWLAGHDARDHGVFTAVKEMLPHAAFEGDIWKLKVGAF